MNTICAISTPYGSGGIAVVRVSGESAIQIVDSLFHGRKPLSEAKAYTVHYGEIRREAIGVEVLDQVLVSVFRAPHSFTGEDVVEIACHGSIYIQQTILQWLVDAGCLLAKAGEFTQRAFLNGKMDLTEAEAVADLIAAQTKAEKDLALSQLRGGISNELAILRERLLTFTSLIELELDFADHEELEFADRSELNNLANEINTKISSLVSSFKTGNAIKQGIPVAIIGAPNVGKSTLLNALLGEERAIVSDIHGTTRDVIEDTVNLHGITFRFIDTAGIRQTTDVVESIGIKRTYQKMQQASIVLWMIDAIQETHPIPPCEGGSTNLLQSQVLPHREDLGGSPKPLLLLFNKCDQVSPEERTALEQAYAHINAPKLFISAKSRIGLDTLESHLVEAAALPDISQSDVIVTNARHYEALTHALGAIRRVQDGLTMNLSGDFVSQDLRECIHHLSDIVGEVSTDSVLQNIFKHFCIGK